MNVEQFISTLEDRGIMINNHQLSQFDRYFKLLVEMNKHFNLTAITEHKDVYLKHFFDSLTPAFFVKSLQKDDLMLCDVGAGAGFPSIPLKIVFPQLKIIIVDSLNKRINFLETVITELGLTEISAQHTRAEEFGSIHSVYRETFDIVIARAVARMNILSELCLPLVKIGGIFVALKAEHVKNDLKQGQESIKLLGGQVMLDKFLTLPVSEDSRHIIVIKKKVSTSKLYPRRSGMPNKNPLR